MKLIPYIIGLTIIYTVIYSVTILIGLISLIASYYSGEDFLNLLLLIGSFVSVFYTTLFNFLNKNQALNLSNVAIRFNKFYVVITYSVITILGLSLILGVVLDVANLGLTKQIYLDMYYLIVQSSIGIYTGNIINSVFEHTQKITNE